jgi:hypothetical protein
VREGAHARRLSGVSSTVTPASTLPTVSETSIVADLTVWWRDSVEIRFLGSRCSGCPSTSFGDRGSCRKFDVWSDKRKAAALVVLHCDVLASTWCSTSDSQSGPSVHDAGSGTRCGGACSREGT